MNENEDKNKETSVKKNIRNLIILDESGSMIQIYNSTLKGVNSTLKTIYLAQKEYENQDHFVTLIAFDSERYDKIYDNVSASEIKDITETQYRPWANTPLFDTIGRAVNELSGAIEEDDVVLVTIITDGYENASKEYNCEAVRSLIERFKEKGWVFTYIGANQNVELVASSLSIDNYLLFQADETGAEAMFRKDMDSRQRFFACASACTDISQLQKGYFTKDADISDIPF